jgi:hypothetical protein
MTVHVINAYNLDGIGGGITLPNPVAAGDLIAVSVVGWEPGGWNLPTDSQGNTYSLAFEYDGVTRGAGVSYTTVEASGSLTITQVLGDVPDSLILQLRSDVGPVVFDQVDHNSGVGTAIDCGSITTRYRSTVLVAQAWLATAVTGGGGGSWVWFSGDPNENLSQYLVTTAIGTYDATGTGSPSGEFDGIVASFTDKSGADAMFFGAP